MPILKIARMGHPVLAAKAKEVPDPTASAIRRLVRNMVETMLDSRGAGLSAPQVYTSLRVVVFRVPPEPGEPDAEDGDGEAENPTTQITVLVNPVIEPLTEEKELGWEGCLSVPGMTGAVPRYTRIRYRGQTLAGQEIVREASGFHARVVQHECDHLDGILYPMRIEDMTLFGFEEEVRRRNAAAQAARQARKEGNQADDAPGDDETAAADEITAPDAAGDEAAAEDAV